MDKYEIRRLRLIQLRDEQCGGVTAELARRIEKDASYVNRVLWEEGKKGRKRIGEDIVDATEKAFKLPHGWLDGISENNQTIENGVDKPSNRGQISPLSNAANDLISLIGRLDVLGEPMRKMFRSSHAMMEVAYEFYRAHDVDQAGNRELINRAEEFLQTRLEPTERRKNDRGNPHTK